jgi:DNA-binding response OmpR family regulator
VGEYPRTRDNFSSNITACGVNRHSAFDSTPVTTHKLLLADDDPKLLEILGSFLQEEGFEVTRASDGGRALDLMQRQAFSLLVTDLDMPRATGTELLAFAKEKGLPMPVVIITANGDEEARKQAAALGAADYVTKPIQLDALLETIHRLL